MKVRRRARYGKERIQVHGVTEGHVLIKESANDALRWRVLFHLHPCIYRDGSFVPRSLVGAKNSGDGHTVRLMAP